MPTLYHFGIFLRQSQILGTRNVTTSGNVTTSQGCNHSYNDTAGGPALFSDPWYVELTDPLSSWCMRLMMIVQIKDHTV